MQAYLYFFYRFHLQNYEKKNWMIPSFWRINVTFLKVESILQEIFQKNGDRIIDKREV